MFGIGYHPGQDSSEQNRGRRPSFTFVSAGMLDSDHAYTVEEGEEDCDLLELARLSKQEEKVIQPHEERVEVVIPSTAEDMPGSDTDVVVHKLPWREDCPLKKQNASASKSQTGEGHLADRGKSFDQLRQFKLRLNSDKCTIRVRSGCSPTEIVYAGSYHFVDFEMDLIRKQSRGVLSNYIARQPVEDYQPMKFEFPDEDISSMGKCEAGILGTERRCAHLLGQHLSKLVYGMEVVLPVEVQIPSLRVLMDVKLQEAEWVRTRYEELSLIEEKRLAAICHGQLYQQRLKRAFDKKVRPRVYHVGDMVLKRILSPQNNRRGKWTPNYEGPFVVKKVFLWQSLVVHDHG
ncbi:hypothetical protein KIW84_065633 [Lathyrus oleraceus]|uniref:Uncharacterized protein n=1 Tax=Pisum sativum TaxID=3888 RepID=A0A9D5A7Q0_PEA|nr:hypothetical protein KIW84_065633 [Pisum sativum]